MILYRPTDGDVLTSRVKYQPRTAIIMTQLGEPIPSAIHEVRDLLEAILNDYKINAIDANSIITGKDFLLKIWNIIISVPIGIGVIDANMPSKTLANIFYEIGLLQAYGKETLIIKTPKAQIPSDFVRTEYVEFGQDFEMKIKKYLDSLFDLPDFFENMADQLIKNPCFPLII